MDRESVADSDSAPSIAEGRDLKAPQLKEVLSFGEWHALAVSVRGGDGRAPGGVALYVDGAALGQVRLALSPSLPLYLCTYVYRYRYYTYHVCIYILFVYTYTSIFSTNVFLAPRGPWARCASLCNLCALNQVALPEGLSLFVPEEDPRVSLSNFSARGCFNGQSGFR